MPKASGSAERVSQAIELVRSFVKEFAADENIAVEAEILLGAVCGIQDCCIDPVVQSRLSVITNHHIWKHWYYEGIPLSARIAYWAAIETDVLSIPSQYLSRRGDFIEHMQCILDREKTLRHSEVVGGWLFPGEPQVLWEIARLACKNEGEFCELGTWAGRSATILAGALKHFSPNKRLILVDDWKWGLDNDVYPFMNENRDIFAELTKQLAPYTDILIPIRGLILEEVTNVKIALNGRKLALLHHDSGHSYEQVRAELSVYIELLGYGGYLLVHDYNHPQNPGTKQAVDELVSQSDSLYHVSVFNTFGLFQKRPEGELQRIDRNISLGTEQDNA